MWDYLNSIHKLVGNLQKRLHDTQENLSEIQNTMAAIGRQPLFERKDGKKDTVLGIDERSERTSKKYTEVKKAAEYITSLINKNIQLFEMNGKEDSVLWSRYIDFVDGIIVDHLYRAIGCRYFNLF